MPPQMDITPLPEEGLFHPGLLVYDLIYHLSKTLFLKQSERAGAKTINGLPMLIYQGTESFYLWTGIKLEEKEELEMIERMTKDCQKAEKKGEKR
jgi:shikimate dehydrogenase